MKKEMPQECKEFNAVGYGFSNFSNHPSNQNPDQYIVKELVKQIPKEQIQSEEPTYKFKPNEDKEAYSFKTPDESQNSATSKRVNFGNIFQSMKKLSSAIKKENKIFKDSILIKDPETDMKFNHQLPDCDQNLFRSNRNFIKRCPRNSILPYSVFEDYLLFKCYLDKPDIFGKTKTRQSGHLGILFYD